MGSRTEAGFNKSIFYAEGLKYDKVPVLQAALSHSYGMFVEDLRYQAQSARLQQGKKQRLLKQMFNVMQTDWNEVKTNINSISFYFSYMEARF